MPIGDLIYYEVTSRFHPRPANLFVLETSTGPVRAIRLDHPTMRWTFDPMTVHVSLMEDIDEGEDRISEVSRSRAEEIARLLGSPLPSEAQLHQLIEAGAGATPN